MKGHDHLSNYIFAIGGGDEGDVCRMLFMCELTRSRRMILNNVEDRDERLDADSLL